VVEEADETVYWLELLEALESQSEKLVRLRNEASQLIAIFAAALKKSRFNK